MMKRASFDSPDASKMLLRIRSLGRNHVEGTVEILGVAKP
jgi:hypothetical protein